MYLKCSSSPSPVSPSVACGLPGLLLLVVIDLYSCVVRDSVGDDLGLVSLDVGRRAGAVRSVGQGVLALREELLHSRW